MSRKGKGRSKFTTVHKLAAGVWLLAFIVIVIAGFQAGASVSTMVMRAAVVTLIISLISRVVVSIFATSEEMNGG